MEEDFYSRMRSKPAESRSARPVIGAALAAFLLGGVAVGLGAWYYGFDWSSDEAGSVTTELPEPASSPGAGDTEASADAAVAVQAAEMVAEQQGGTEARVTAMEQRLTQLDLQAQAAYGNATRAEALLVAFATRRAIDRGMPLGYLEEQLKVRFGDAFPNAVAAIVAAAEQPVTPDHLRGGLDGLAGQLLADPQAESGWGWFTREIGELFVIRKASTPSPAPERRLDRARLFLETGRIEEAIAEVRQLPGSDSAGKWLAEAGRHAAALEGLDRLETSAILGSEGVSDITGAPARPTQKSGAQ